MAPGGRDFIWPTRETSVSPPHGQHPVVAIVPRCGNDAISPTAHRV